MADHSAVSRRGFRRGEIGLWIGGLIVAIVGHGAAGSVLETLESMAGAHVEVRSTHAGAAIGWTVAFLLATLGLYATYANPHSTRLPGRSRGITLGRALAVWVAATLAILSFYGVATAIHRDINSWSLDGFPPALFGGYVIALMGSLLVVARLRDRVLIVHTVREQRKGFPKRTHLIVYLAAIKTKSYEATGWWPPASVVRWSDPPDLDADLQELVRAKSTEGSDDAARGMPYWPWEMTLRALRAHRGRLDRVILVCSPQSIVQAAAFAGRASKYPDFAGVKFGVWAESGSVLKILDATDGHFRDTQGVEFDGVDDLSATTVDLLHELIDVQGVPASEIMIDFTGGKKPVSFVAAAATMRGEVLAQYVDTEIDGATADHRVYPYDIVANPEVRGIG